MEKKFSSRKDKAQETKRRLYTTAEALFTQYGFDNVSVDKIVNEAGLSKGTFYVHYESKDDLLVSLISEYVGKVDMDYQAFMNTFSPDISTEDMLMQLVEKIMNVIIEKIGLEKMKTLYKAQLTNISQSSAAINYQRKLYTIMINVLDRGMRRNEIATNLASEELANHLILAMRGLIYEWCIRYPYFDLKTQSNAHFKMILKGIK